MIVTADGKVIGALSQTIPAPISPGNGVLEKNGIDSKMKLFGERPCSAGLAYYIIDNDNTLYRSTFDEFKKLHENIIYFTMDWDNYYAVDENGRIWSDARAFTSDDWILTTNITYDGKKVNSDVPPYVKDGRTLAPMRAILEALGMTVSWDPSSQTATAVKADINISISINSNIAIVNNTQQSLDVPAEITNGRTFVPVRFFAEALGMKVDWDSYTKTVSINTK